MRNTLPVSNYSTRIYTLFEHPSHIWVGHSLSAGFTDLPWQWGFVALLDMPYVRRNTLNALIDYAEGSNKLVQPRLINRKLRL